MATAKHKRLVKSYPNGTQVHYVYDWQEYRVVNKNLDAATDYHTSDRLDALGTAQLMDMEVGGK